MRRWLALTAVLLAGCSAAPPAAPADAPDPGLVAAWTLDAQGCYTTAIFFLVEYHQADAFLPPAFRPRDLAGFLYNTPVTSGKVPAFVALSTCDAVQFGGPAVHEGALQITYLGFFVEAPGLGSAYAAQAADFDFYSVAYLGPDQGEAGVPFEITGAYGWRNEPAAVTLDVTMEQGQDIPLPPGLPVPRRAEALAAAGSLHQDGQEVFSFEAQAFFPQTFQDAPKLRFWHDGPHGLGFIEFDLPMQTVPAGPLASCHIEPGSLIHDVVGHAGGEAVCGPLNSFALAFGRHDLDGRLHHFEGLRGASPPEAPPAELPPSDAARLRVRVPLQVEQAVTTDDESVAARAPSDPGQGTWCHNGAGASLPLDGWHRYDDAFASSVGQTPFIRFRDDYQENGCGEARFQVTVPPAATSMTVTFLVDRQVESEARFAEPRAFQTLRLYAGDPHRPVPVACFGQQEVFPPGWPSTQRAQTYTATFDFQRCDPAEIAAWHEAGLVVAFGFEDGGPVASHELPEGVAAGQLFRATVYAPHVYFDGTLLPLQPGASEGLDPERKVVGFVRRGVDVPAPLPGQEHEVAFAISNQHGILGLYKRSSDGLHRISDQQIEAREVEGQLVFTIGADVVAAHGAGGYEVLFTAQDTGRVSMLRMPLVAVALLLPLVTGAVAQRNLTHVHRLAARPRPRQRHVLQGLLALAWAAYVAVALYLFLADAGIGMAAWPVPPANLVAYLVLATIAASMIAIAVAARRLELSMVRHDLSQLERAQQELERSNRELEQFAYVASHDLKEPLRVVAGYTQLLGMRYGDRLDEKGRSFLNFAADGAGRLQRMVDDMLAYSRVRPDPGGARPVALDEAMAAVRLHLQGMIEQRGVRLQVDALPIVMADRGQVVQLLLNLVQNAIKFSPQQQPIVQVSATRDDEQVTVCVRDEGIGIDPRQQDRVFQIFQRLHLREEYEGNGIGLAVCRKIVEQFGGRIWVESAPGRGSTFCFTLPSPPRREGSPTRTRRPHGSGAPATA